MTSYLVIVNPASGKGSAPARAEALRRVLADSCSVRVVETSRRGSGVELAASVGTEVDRVIAVGGDGTLNEVLTGLLLLGRSAAETPALGFVPAGTANAATRAFDFTPDPEAVAAALPTTPVREVDVGVADFGEEERPFLMWCGAGFDAVVIDELNRSRTGHMGITGLLRHAPRVLRALSRYRAPPIRMEIDGHPAGDAGSVILTNVPDVAFGGTVVGTADPFDGRLDVVSVDPAPWPRLVGMGLRMMTSELCAAPGVRHRLCDQIRLESPGTVPVQIDGEPVGVLPVSVRLRPGAVRLLLT